MQTKATKIEYNDLQRSIVNFLQVFLCILTQNLMHYRNQLFLWSTLRRNYKNNLPIATKFPNHINKNQAFEKTLVDCLIDW